MKLHCVEEREYCYLWRVRVHVTQLHYSPIILEQSFLIQSFLAVYVMQKEVKGILLKETELKIKNAVGLRHVIDLLSSEKKLVVGHNCFLGTKYLLQNVIKIYFFMQVS